MIKNLVIEQFVIIDRLDLDFESGLTILTGETGAGKSILLDAMGLVLGEESNPDSIRQGSEQSLIQARFDFPPEHGAYKFLEEHKLADAGKNEFTVHRVLKRAGRDEIKINDRPVELETLKELGLFLVEIHGQFANQSITDPLNQIKWLDASGAFPPEIFKNVADALADVRRLTKDLEEEKLFVARHKRDLPKLTGLERRFNDIGMKEGAFVHEAEEEYARLLRAKETSEAFQAILGRLIAANGVIVALSASNDILSRQENVDREKIAELDRHLVASADHARKAVREINSISPEYEIDTEPLHRYGNILKVLRSIAEENKLAFEQMPEFFEEVTGKLMRLRNGREKIAEIDNALAEAKVKYREHAHILHEKRVEAAKVLSKSITEELPPLKLNKAEFDVLVEEKLDIPWTELGLDVVTYTARMNPGMPFSPISETASGGEMARLILALKVVLQRVQTTPTLVFDEVDTGIGGSAAAAVGERLAMLAEGTQVLVITHSPQVASRGDTHLHVSKKTDGITTVSMLRILTPDERINEISRMLAGDQTTAESNAAAKRLIDEAQTAAKSRGKNLEKA